MSLNSLALRSLCTCAPRSLQAVAVEQLSSVWNFWFNTVTSVPVAWIEWATVRVHARARALAPTLVRAHTQE